MSYRMVFDAKDPAATVSASFDFAASLAVGETISSASTTATVYSGTDATPAAILSGAATPSGGKVVQKLTGGVSGVVYYLFCAAMTSTGQVLVRDGYLAVEAG